MTHRSEEPKRGNPINAAVALLTEAQRAFARYSVASSDLKWTGRPPSGLRLRRVDTLLIPFSLMWGGFAIFWETMALRGGAPFFFRLWGIPFVLYGIYFMIGRFFWDAYRRSTTWYGLTADSALILREGWLGRFNEYICRRSPQSAWTLVRMVRGRSHLATARRSGKAVGTGRVRRSLALRELPTLKESTTSAPLRRVACPCERLPQLSNDLGIERFAVDDRIDHHY